MGWRTVGHPWAAGSVMGSRQPWLPTEVNFLSAGVINSSGGKPATNMARWRIPHALKIERAGQ